MMRGVTARALAAILSRTSWPEPMSGYGHFAEFIDATAVRPDDVAINNRPTRGLIRGIPAIMNLEASTRTDANDPIVAPPVPANARKWLIWPFRILMTLTVLQLFNQAIFAGQFLDGNFGALRAHHDHAYFALYSMIVTAVSALLIKRPGGNILIWPFLASIGLVVLIYIQIELGLVRSIAIHVPLGVAIIVAAAFLTAWSWRSRGGS